MRRIYTCYLLCSACIRCCVRQELDAKEVDAKDSFSKDDSDAKSLQFSAKNWQGNIIQLSRYLTRMDFGQNLSFMVFTVYLSDLLVSVGFVTGVTFKTHLTNTILIDVLTLW